MNKIIVKPFASALVKHGMAHENVVVVTNDLTASCEADEFASTFPDRFISAGMAEQGLVLALSGLAREGLIPIFPSFAVFTTRRPYEQIALTIAYPNLPVRLFGFLPGLTTPGGVSHQATDDIGLMKQLPNMTVIEAADATDMETVIDGVFDMPGPVYIRSLRGMVPRLFKEPFEVGKSREIFAGDRVLVLVTGALTAMAIETVESLRAEFSDLGLICINTLKPFGDQALFSAIAKAKVVITLENHLVESGLASATAMRLAKFPGPTLVTIGIQDTFTHGGSFEYLLKYYAIDANRLKKEIFYAYGKSLAPKDDDLDLLAKRSELNANVAEGL